MVKIELNEIELIKLFYKNECFIIICNHSFDHPRLLKEVEAELRIGSTLRSKLTEDLASIKNRNPLA